MAVIYREAMTQVTFVGLTRAHRNMYRTRSPYSYEHRAGGKLGTQTRSLLHCFHPTVHPELFIPGKAQHSPGLAWRRQTRMGMEGASLRCPEGLNTTRRPHTACSFMSHRAVSYEQFPSEPHLNTPNVCTARCHLSHLPKMRLQPTHNN